MALESDQLTETVKIKVRSRLSFRLAAWGGKRRNKRLLKGLAAWNRDLMPPAFLNSALNLTSGDLSFLKSLAALRDGWHPFEISPTAVPGDQMRLAALGLILAAWRPDRLMLSDAGRFLLSLNAVDPALTK